MAEDSQFRKTVADAIKLETDKYLRESIREYASDEIKKYMATPYFKDLVEKIVRQEVTDPSSFVRNDDEIMKIIREKYKDIAAYMEAHVEEVLKTAAENFIARKLRS